MKNSTLFNQIVSEKLSAVTFVMDYVQLRFDGPIITVLTPMLVNTSKNQASSGQDQFRNLLCEQIAKKVLRVEVKESDSFNIHFVDSSYISISLRESDYVGPEALKFDGVDKKWDVI